MEVLKVLFILSEIIMIIWWIRDLIVGFIVKDDYLLRGVRIMIIPVFFFGWILGIIYLIMRIHGFDKKIMDL